MKITMVGTFPPIKGISRTYCVPLADALSRYVDVDFAGFSRIYPERLYPGGTREPGAPFKRPDNPRLRVRSPLSWYNPLGWLWTGLRFPGQLLHIHWWTFYLAPVELAILMMAKMRGRPVVMTVHNVLGHETSRLDRMLTRWAFKFPKTLIVHTGENRRQLVEIFGVPAERIEVVPFGALTGYDDAPLTRDEARRELGLAPTDRVALFFGNIRDYKGLDVLLRAFKQTIERVPNARLIVAGTCWKDEAKYRRLVEELGISMRVRLDLAYVPSEKVKVYFRAADLVVLPYLHFEAQSGPGNIALGFSKPLVVTRTGGLPELVRDSRAVAPPGDAAALARTMADCLNDPERLAQMAADSAALAKEYSWDRIAERTVKIYEKLLPSEKG